MWMTINMHNVHSALILMVQGMTGIFVTIIIIMIIVWLISKLSISQDATKSDER